MSALLLLAAAVANPAMPPALARAVAAYDAATVANDTEALGRLVRDDYLLINSDTSQQDKASYLSDFRVPGFRLQPYTLTDTRLVLQGDSALLSGSMRLRWTQDGQAFDRDVRIMHFWVKDIGQWRLVYSQLTRNTG